ncbi:hypothetical protein BV898_14905 [Hypsibius exemplaris]|uniref:Uncharacterized protein n=1 Tax=Hypsibius exemplaris TaxID=2072580 RepID=A0A9X6NCV4_HYPEX|nr:hypothetical protein BV898_14905 [Hypsibius exemplaris]
MKQEGRENLLPHRTVFDDGLEDVIADCLDDEVYGQQCDDEDNWDLSNTITSGLLSQAGISRGSTEVVGGIGGWKNWSRGTISVYQAMSFKIQGRGTDSVLVYHEPILSYIRGILRRRSVNRKGPRDRQRDSVHLAAVEWAP